MSVAKRQGHLPARDGLLELKVQVVPNFLRMIPFGGSVGCGIAE